MHPNFANRDQVVYDILIGYYRARFYSTSLICRRYSLLVLFQELSIAK